MSIGNIKSRSEACSITELHLLSIATMMRISRLIDSTTSSSYATQARVDYLSFVTAAVLFCFLYKLEIERKIKMFIYDHTDTLC
jgi:hypothetical protein